MPSRKPRLALAPALEPVTPRDVLRARLALLAETDAAIREAERLVEIGQRNLAEMEARAVTGEDVERRIRAHRVQVLKDGGSGADELPEMLETARTIARRARDGLADAKATLADLGNELTDVQAQRLAVLEVVEVAAQDVIRAEDAPRLAAELQAANAHRDRLHRELEALSSLHVRQGFVGYIPGVPPDAPHYRATGPIMLGPDVPAALNPVPSWQTMTQEQVRAVPAAWGSYFRALMQDADATPPA